MYIFTLRDSACVLKGLLTLEPKAILKTMKILASRNNYLCVKLAQKINPPFVVKTLMPKGE